MNFVLNKRREKDRRSGCRGALTTPVWGPGQKRAPLKSGMPPRAARAPGGRGGTARYRELHTPLEFSVSLETLLKTKLTFKKL